jgi:ribonucleoside-diphosphate reductase alpha chain
MLNTVTKYDGTTEPFSAEKLNRLATFAAVDDTLMSDISINTLSQLYDGVSTQAIIDSMVKYCVLKEDIRYSRAAARLEEMIILKNAERIGVDCVTSLEDTIEQLIDLGIWDGDVLPPYNTKWESWLLEFNEIQPEYWTIKQWSDKYGCKHDHKCIETVQVGAIGIGLAHFGDTEYAYKAAKAIVLGKLNLATPALNGGRNGDFDSVSCSVITGGDTTESIGVAEHIAYRMTAKKAGIGIELDTRSKGAPVKGGRVQHLGKHPLYKCIDTAVKAMTQVTRGGSATVTFKCIDPEITQLLQWKTQKVDIETRIDKLDYSFAYTDAMMESLIQKKDWKLYDLYAAPKAHAAFYEDNTLAEWEEITADLPSTGSITAIDLVKLMLTGRGSTGRIYPFSISRANKHTPFKEPIRLSNLCQEIMLPTRPYTGMLDLYVGNDNGESDGEVAFCSLAAINYGKVTLEEIPELTEIALRIVDSMIEKAPGMTDPMKRQMLKRRSVGIGITGLANYLYANGLDYDNSPESFAAVNELAEAHMWHLYCASIRMLSERKYTAAADVTDWIPTDTAVNFSKYKNKLDWELIRGLPRLHSVLVAHMPTESSAVFSGACNGLYPPRDRVIYKKARTGLVQFILDKDDFIPAWDVDNIVMAKYYSCVQDWTDQGISADYYQVPDRFPDGKVPMSKLLREFIAQWKLGAKTMYYTNTRDVDDNNAKTAQEAILAAQNEVEEGCEGGSCKL